MRPCPPGKNKRPRGTAGYTLLEVILALALSVLLIGGITVAINYHLQTLRQQQEEIERAQVARQSLFLITQDIRSAIQYKPIETSALNELIESVTAATDLGSLAEEAGVDAGMIDDAGLQQAEESDAAPSQYSATRPGLYGTTTQLQIDVSRLPRRDQYNLVNFSNGTQSDIPSDVKTITYFVRNEDNFQQSAGSDSVNINESMGLVRRSLDRAVTRYANDYGAEISLEDYEEILAEEITQIEFRYWDQENKQWETEWDSDEKMGMPGAVEVTVALGIADDDDDDETEERKIYRSVVYLPLAEIIPPELETPEEGSEGSGATGSTDDQTGGMEQ